MSFAVFALFRFRWDRLLWVSLLAAVVLVVAGIAQLYQDHLGRDVYLDTASITRKNGDQVAGFFVARSAGDVLVAQEDRRAGWHIELVPADDVQSLVIGPTTRLAKTPDILKQPREPVTTTATIGGDTTVVTLVEAAA